MAAVLGGYILLYPKARVVTLIFIVFFFTILELPAMLILGFWFLQQVAFGYFEMANPAGGGGGVAYFAHIGGFVFGLLLIKLFASRAEGLLAAAEIPRVLSVPAARGRPRNDAIRLQECVTVSPDRKPVVVTDLEEAIDAVRATGLRLTAARRLVLEALLAARKPISAEDIADGLGGKMTAVGHRVGLPQPRDARRARPRAPLPRRPWPRPLRPGGLRRPRVPRLRVLRGAGVRRAGGAGRRARAVRELSGFEARFSHFPIVGLCARCAQEAQEPRHARTALSTQSRAAPAARAPDRRRARRPVTPVTTNTAANSVAATSTIVGPDWTSRW